MFNILDVDNAAYEINSTSTIEMSFILRPGTLDDATGIANVQVTTWRDAYATIIDPVFLAGMTVEAFTQAQIDRIQTDSGHRTVATIDDKVVGYAVSRAKTDEPFFNDWFLFALYVLPECQGLGIGRALINDTKAEGHKRGFTRLVFGVFSHNEPSKRFYRRNGAVFIEQHGYEIDGKDYPTDYCEILID
ncbi:MAG: GNAT family N-acetyltransferase [Armatimonadota bacterium]